MEEPIVYLKQKVLFLEYLSRLFVYSQYERKILIKIPQCGYMDMYFIGLLFFFL